MLKKTVTYVDFDGKTKTETHYFNLTKAELITLELNDQELAEDGKTVVQGKGFVDRLQAVAKSGKGRLIMASFREFLLESYGIRSEDGTRFQKSPEISEAFSQTAAYSEIFSEIILDPTAAVNFINNVVPADLAKAAEEQMAKQAARSDGRPPLQDHLPKKTVDQSSIRVDDLPAAPPVLEDETNELTEANVAPSGQLMQFEAGPSGQEMKVEVSSPEADSSYQEWLRQRDAQENK